MRRLVQPVGRENQNHASGLQDFSPLAFVPKPDAAAAVRGEGPLLSLGLCLRQTSARPYAHNWSIRNNHPKILGSIPSSNTGPATTETFDCADGVRPNSLA